MDEQAEQEVAYSIKQVMTLVNEDASFAKELFILRRAYRRYSIRFRNSITSSKIKRVVSLTKRFHRGNYIPLLDAHLNQLRTVTKASKVTNKKKKLRKLITTILKLINETANLTDQILDHSLYAYGQVKQHLKIGHLVFHYLALTSCLSRTNIMFKALLIHFCDIYKLMYPLMIEYGLAEEEPLPKDNLDQLLMKHGCKPRNFQKAKEKPAEPRNSEDFGQKIDRNSFLSGS